MGDGSYSPYTLEPFVTFQLAAGVAGFFSEPVLGNILQGLPSSG
jgi:hypothetical protein